MPDPFDAGNVPRDADLVSVLSRLFHTEPGVGFAVCDSRGRLLYANARSAELLLRGTPEQAIGRTLEELFGAEWAAERLAMLRQTRQTGRPVISRHIRFGVQVQSTIRVLVDEGSEDEATFSVMTTEGEIDPPDPDRYDIIESKLMHLGPLNALTRREIEVLSLIGHGISTPRIAEVLHRSPRTIEQHCESIRQKLKGASRVQIADFARRACLTLDDATLERI